MNISRNKYASWVNELADRMFLRAVFLAYAKVDWDKLFADIVDIEPWLDNTDNTLDIMRHTQNPDGLHDLSWDIDDDDWESVLRSFAKAAVRQDVEAAYGERFADWSWDELLQAAERAHESGAYERLSDRRKTDIRSVQKLLSIHRDA